MSLPAYLAACAALIAAVLLATAGVPPPQRGHAGRCTSYPAPIYHRPSGAGSLRWAETLAFVPRCGH